MHVNRPTSLQKYDGQEFDIMLDNWSKANADN
jgi:hypothetical protein